MRLELSVAAIIALSSLQLAHAQQTQDPAPRSGEVIGESRNPELIGSFDIDTSIPDSPGFAAIGLEPTKVLDPGVEPITYAALSQFLDDDHNLKTGFAIGGTPYWWLNRQKPLDEYRSSDHTTSFERILARTTVSLGFADGGENPDRIGLGLKTDLLSNADYRLDTQLYDCVSAAYSEEIGITYRPSEEQRAKFVEEAIAQLRAAGKPTDPDAVDALVTDIEAAWRENLRETVNDANYLRRVDECRDDASERYAVRASWIVAVGGSFSQEQGGGSWDQSGTSLWTAYRLPLDFLGKVDSKLGKQNVTPAYATFFANYDLDQIEEIDEVDTQYDASTVGVVAGYERDKLKLSLQAGYKWLEYEANASGLEDDAYEVFVVSAAWRLNKTLWLKLDAGQTGEREASTNDRDSYFKLSFAYDLQ